MERPEPGWARRLAISVLGNGLADAGHNEDALSVGEAELSMLRRLGGAEDSMLAAKGNLASTYEVLGRKEEALSMRRDVYSGRLKLFSNDDLITLIAALNYAGSLNDLKRFEESRALLRRTMPVARRALGESHEIMLWIRWTYAKALYTDDASTLDDLHEADNTLGETARTARRVLGGAHPLTVDIEHGLRSLREALEQRRDAALGTT